MDELINTIDHALRVIAGVNSGGRPSPAVEGLQPLAADDRDLAAALMRVNHSGEICAQALYQGQALASRNAGIQVALAKAAQEEQDHLHWSQQRIAELGGHTSLLNSLWYIGSFAIGYAAGKMGDEINLGFLAETERQVEQHLSGHLSRLSPEDVRTRSLLEAMREEEAGHGETAHQLGAAELPAPARLAMKLASKVMTAVSFRV